MELTIQAIHFTASDIVKDYLENKVDKMQRFHDKIIHAEAILRKEHMDGQEKMWVELKMKVPGNLIVAKETGNTFEEAIDLCVSKVQPQIKKHNEKLKNYKE